MNPLLLAGTAALMTAAPLVQPLAPDPAAELAQLSFHSRVVIRVRTITAIPTPRPLATMFRERKGPDCVPLVAMAGAAVISPNSVDIVLRTGERLRARFAASCPALDYYGGFYIAPTADGKLCAARDAVRDRAGGECAVQRIRLLERRK